MKKLLPFLFLVGCHGAVHVDNDYFNLFSNNGDKYYTHGTQITYSTDEEAKMEGGRVEAASRTSYSLGQTIYTPSSKKPDAPSSLLLRDRPYTGWLYLEFRRDFKRDAATGHRDSYAVQLGCTGRCSQAEEVQRGVHRLIGQGIPSWNPEFSLHSEPAFLIMLERSKNVKFSNRDSVNSVIGANYYGGSLLGTITDNVYGGAILKAGYNIDADNEGKIIFKEHPTASRGSKLRFFTFCDGQERLVAYNHLLEGSLFQDERHTVTPEHLVTEGNVGFVLGYKNFNFTYSLTLISSEWKEKPGSFVFGGLNFQW